MKCEKHPDQYIDKEHECEKCFNEKYYEAIRLSNLNMMKRDLEFPKYSQEELDAIDKQIFGKVVIKDWSGNGKSVYSTLGASNHVKEERQSHDYYATDPKAAELLLTLETFNKNIWECACGEGHLSRVFSKHGYVVKSSDLVNRGFGEHGVDFLSIENQDWNGDIITNPPYVMAKEFIEKALQIIPEGNKVAMFLKVQFLEGKARKELFKIYPPKTVWVSSSRLNCAKNGDFSKNESAVAYAWFIWQKGFKGTTEVKWFN